MSETAVVSGAGTDPSPVQFSCRRSRGAAQHLPGFFGHVHNTYIHILVLVSPFWARPETCFLFRATDLGHAGQPRAKLVLCWVPRLYCILNNLGE